MCIYIVYTNPSTIACLSSTSNLKARSSRGLGPLFQIESLFVYWLFVCACVYVLIDMYCLVMLF